MPFCQYCGEEIGYLPFKCKYCGGTFCKSHRLPENHKCSFELKHAPVIPDTLREARPLYQDAVKLKPVSRKDEYRWEKERKKYQKRQEQQRKRAMRSYISTASPYGETGGTTFLIILILIFSIIGFILPLYICLSIYGLSQYYLWIIFTSIFSSVSTLLPITVDSFEFTFNLLFLFILIMFLYNIARNIEIRFGKKFLLQLYFFCAFFTGLFYFFLRFLLIFYYPINEFNIVCVGLASGAMFGLISLFIFFYPDQEMMMCCFFIPIKMKGKTLLTLIILLRIVPGFGFAIIYSNLLYIVLFLPDLGGVFAAYLVFYFKYKSR